MTTANYSEFREHRTQEELSALLHHGHIIPASKGLTQAHVAKHFPGWSWNQLFKMLKSAGVVVHNGKGAPPKCDRSVKAFHFNNQDDYAVEWNETPSAVDHDSLDDSR